MKKIVTKHFLQGRNAKKILLTMKLTILFLVASMMHVSASVYSQATKFNFTIENEPIVDVLAQIEEASNFRFFFQREQVNVQKTVSFTANNVSVEKILEFLFKEEGILYKVLEDDLILLASKSSLLSSGNKTFLSLKQVEVRGTVTDSDGNPIPGANVAEAGTSNGTITDLDGNYSIYVSNENAVLQFSYIGYIAQSITVGSQTVINVRLEVEETDLDEVVVIGYGMQKKKLATGANLNVKGEDIQQLTPSNPMDALQGISPGVNITRNNGQPGSGTKVYIRGIGTTGNSNPLYIVDGVTVGNIDYLSPADIESIDILKDAASSAIYGSRAANGVILVTTKKGKKGKPVITYDGYQGWQNVYKKSDLLMAQEYAIIMNEGRVNDGLLPYDYAAIIPDWDRIESGEWKGTNWFDEISIKDAYIQSHALNITGGSARSIYSIGASYLNDEGILGTQANSCYKRLNLRLNTEHILIEKSNLKIITIGQNLSYTNSENPGIRTGNIYWNDVHNMLVASPFKPVYGDDGNYHAQLPDWNAQAANPIGLMDYLGRYNYDKSNSIVGNVYLEIQPFEHLKFRSSYGIDSWFGSSRQWIPAYNLSTSSFSEVDQVNQNMFQGYQWTFTNTISYSHSFNEKHNFSVVLGHEMFKVSQALGVSGHNENSLFNDAEHAYLSNVPTVDATYTTITGRDDYGSALMSYFGRVSYNFDEKYMLSVVMRADGSSNFMKGKRWGFFPSVSAGWVVTNESFMEGASSWLDFLKIRSSMGQNGNQAIGAFQYSSTITYSGANYFFGPDKTVRSIGGYPARVPNTNVTWETSEQLNFGVDAHFFAARLQLNLDWYKKDTRDWLVNPPALSTNGTASSYINGGRVTNQGIELSLSWNDQAGAFRYGVTGSFAYNENEVTEIANDEKIFHGESNVLSQGTSEMYRAEVGFPIGYFWGFQTNGILQNQADVDAWVTPEGTAYFDDTRPGDVRFVDQNNDGLIDDKDKVMIGNPNPDYIFGIQLHTEYKGFYLNATATGQAGHQIAKSYRSFADNPKHNYTTDIFGRWHGEGTSDKLPRLSSISSRNSNYISDIYIENADFLRISNITFGYNFNNIIENWPFSETRLYVTAKNLYTFTSYSGMDPEVGYGPQRWASGIDLGLYPASRTFLVGLSIKF